MYGAVAFVKHRPNSTTASKAYKTSSPFIISETIGNEEVICGSVVNLIQEERHLVAAIRTQTHELGVEFRHIQPTEFKTVTSEFKYERVFDFVNQAFGEDSLVS